LLADVVGMTHMMTTDGEANDHSYDGRKSGRRGDAGATVEVRVRAERRRPWPDEDKLRIVRETLVPGATVQAVADRHGVSTGQLYTWRKQLLAMAMSGFTPVEVRPEALPAPPSAPASETLAPAATGDLQVVLPGGAELRFSGTVTPGLLREVLAALGGR
jgi:transposase